MSKTITNEQHFIFLFDKIFNSYIVKNNGNIFREDTITETAVDGIAELLGNEEYFEEFSLTGDSVSFQWVFNESTKLQEEVGDISVVVTWEKDKKMFIGFASLEAKRNSKKGGKNKNKLYKKEREKCDKYSTRLKGVNWIKYLIYSKQTIKEVNINNDTVEIRAITVPISNVIDTKYCLKPNTYKNKKEVNTIGSQVIKRYMKGHDLLIPPSPPSKNPENDRYNFNDIINAIKDEFGELPESIMLIDADSSLCYDDNELAQNDYYPVLKLARKDNRKETIVAFG